MVGDPMSASGEQGLLSIRAAAKWCDVSENTFRRYILAKVDLVEIGSLKLVTRASLEAWVESQRVIRSGGIVVDTTSAGRSKVRERSELPESRTEELAQRLTAKAASSMRKRAVRVGHGSSLREAYDGLESTAIQGTGLRPESAALEWAHAAGWIEGPLEYVPDAYLADD